MFEERNLFAALAVLLFTYVFLALFALLARGTPLKSQLRRWWRRIAARRNREET